MEPIDYELPDILMADDEPAIVPDENNTGMDFYESLKDKKHAAFNSLETMAEIKVTRDNIARDLLHEYRDHTDICNKRAHITLDGDWGGGDGSQREVYSLFWDSVLSESEGYSEYTVPVLSMFSEEDYVAIGKIITHQFVQTGTSPVRIAKASIQQMLFGNVSESCLVNSFLRMLQPKESECLGRALAGQKFDVDKIMGILQDYNPRALPTSDNIQSLVLSAATAEFTRKPFYCLTKIREGMGSFWNDVSSAEITSLYDFCKPTAAKVISSLKTRDAADTKEVQVFSWLERFLRAASESIVTNFVRFCTATDVLDPARPILVRAAFMPPAAIRPEAQTCFHTLDLAKNYSSYRHLRTNLELFLSDTSCWDLNDG